MKSGKPLGQSPEKPPAPEPRSGRRRRPRASAVAPPPPPVGPDPARADVLDLRVASPFRLPDYRWQIALRLVNGEFVPEGWADEWVRLGERLLRHPPGAELPPDLAAASEARAFLDSASDWARAELEARLLASEPHGDIAAKVGLSAAAVGAYAALFYAVADRLGVPGYVTHTAIGLHDPEHAGDLGRHLRLYGYNAGPFIVDLMTGPEPGPDAPEEERALREKARLALRLSATPVTQANGMQWVRLHQLRLELRARRARV